MLAGESGVSSASQVAATTRAAQLAGRADASVRPAPADLAPTTKTDASATPAPVPAQPTEHTHASATPAPAPAHPTRHPAAAAESADAGAVRRQGLRLVLILVAAFMVVLDFSIVNVALPSIERELGMTAAAAQWVMTGYAIAFAGLLILGGRAADLLGRRRMFIIGLLAFTAASLSGGLAHDPALLIASRVVQGAGAAIVAPAALAL